MEIKTNDNLGTLQPQLTRLKTIVQPNDKTLLHVKEKGRITNAEYQKLNDCSERTASRQISELVKANLLEQAGNFGAGSFYKLKTPE